MFSKLVPAVVGHWFILLRKQFSVCDNFEYQVRRNPKAVALVFDSKRYTFAEIDAEANRVANWAIKQGIKPKDTVALLMPNRLAFPVIRLGLIKVGARLALLNTNVTGLPLAHVLNTSTANIVIIGSELLKSYKSLEDMPHHPDVPRPQIKEVWIHDENGKDCATEPGFFSLNKALENASPKDNNFYAVRSSIVPNDVAYFIYTSGTTGLPKAARVTHKRIDMYERFMCFLLELTTEDRVFVSLPLYHTNGGVLGFSVWHVGGAVVLSRKFSASRCLAECAEAGATVFIYIGELLRYLHCQPRKPSDRDHSLRLCVGNGLRPDIWADFQSRFGIKDIREFYGSTEGNVVLMNVDNKVGSCGYVPRTRLIPAPLLALVYRGKLIRYSVEKDEHPRDSSGRCIESEPSEPGELIGKITTSRFAASGQFEGYTNSEATQRKILKGVVSEGDQWFRTGDLLKRDEDGYFFFVDRIGDTFRWKGENVATSEVSEVLASFSGVDQAVVYGVPIPGLEGKAGMASFQPKDVDNFDFDGLYVYLNKQLAAYANPLFLRVQTSVVTTTTFKYTKVGLVEDGYDPSKISDPLYFRSTEEGKYIRLDQNLFEAINAGKVRV